MAEDTIELLLPDAGITLSTWTEYSFNSHFLTPTDGWHFTVANSDLPQEVRAALVPGALVRLRINGCVQSTGYIDEISPGQDRHAGTVWHISGRDCLSPAVDANADPRDRYAKGTTLLDFLLGVLGPYGFTIFVEDDDANRGVITGQLRGTKTSKKGKPLKSVTLHQLKPYQSEGAFAFASRIAQRQGFWIWPDANGESLVVSKPDFTYDLQTTPKLKRTVNQSNGFNNVLSGGVRRSVTEQPSIIVAQGFGGGGSYARTRMTALVVNPAVNADVQDILNTYPDAKVVSTDYFFAPLPGKFARPMFLHDDESKTPAELENFVRRELALRIHKAFQGSYEVNGHTYKVPDGTAAPWCVNTVVYVDDDVSDVHEPMWVMSRTFTKSRTEGTRTALELVRLNSLVF